MLHQSSNEPSVGEQQIVLVGVFVSLHTLGQHTITL